MSKETSISINFLWTGGWDSTFQLLQLLILERKQVTPYYLIDSGRKSLRAELLAMENIKEVLFKKFLFTEKLLKPTLFFNVKDISNNNKITNASNILAKEFKIGSQYEWLARFCEENEIKNLQLCIHKGGKIHNMMNKCYTSNKESPYLYFLNKQSCDTNLYTVFNYYTFPLLNVDKFDMGEIAKKHGWQSIMQLTWFCHKPTRKMQPCGKCNPCSFVIKQGLSSRIPLTSKIIVFFKSLFK